MNDFLEKFETVRAVGRVRKVGEGSRSRPRHNGDYSNTDDHRRFDFVHDEQCCYDAAAENADPDLANISAKPYCGNVRGAYRRIFELMARTNTKLILILWQAASNV